RTPGDREQMGHTRLTMPAGASSFVAAAALNAHRRLVDPAEVFCDRLVSAPLGQHEERVVGLAGRSSVHEEIAAVGIDFLLEALDGVLEIADLGIALRAGDVRRTRRRSSRRCGSRASSRSSYASDDPASAMVVPPRMIALR